MSPSPTASVSSATPPRTRRVAANSRETASPPSRKEAAGSPQNTDTSPFTHSSRPRPCAGCDEPHQHGVRRQAPDRAQVQRRARAVGHQAVAFQGEERPRREAHDRGGLQGREQGVRRRGDQQHGADQDEGDCRGVPGQDHQERRGHRARLLQRQPAPGDQGRGRDRWAERDAHHQRAHRSRNRLWPGQEGHGRGREERAHLRPGRRHFRREPADHRGGHLRGEGDCGRHALGRRGL